MKKLSLTTALGLAGVIVLGAIAQDVGRSNQDPAPQSAVGNPDFADARGRDGSTTVLLTVGIDARGVQIVEGNAKPDLAYRPHRRWEDQPFRFTLRDARGEELASGGFDPAPMCLDPSHLGQPDHAPGDYLVVHETHTNVRIPDFGDRLDSIAFQVRENGVWRPHGFPTSTNTFGINR